MDFFGHFKSTLSASNEVAAKQKEYARKSQDIYHDLTLVQRRYFDDKAKYKALLVPRRGGKTYGDAAGMCIRGCLYPGSKQLYIALSRQQALINFWEPLKYLNAKYALGGGFNENVGRLSFPNGSKIFVAGAPTIAEVDKYRGSSFHHVTIDEAAAFPKRTLEVLIHQVIAATLVDYDGSLTLASTPGAILAGEFYEATRPNSPVGYRVSEGEEQRDRKYSVHTWGIEHNSAMPLNWERALELKRVNRWSDDNPIWRREYLGEWVADYSSIVYRPTRFWKPTDKPNWGLPPGHKWRFALGMDIGYEDDFALCVCAYSDTHPDMFHVWDFSRQHMLIPDIVREVTNASEMFGGFDAIVADTGGGGSKVITETYLTEWGVPIQAAEKKEKRDWIEIVNSDMYDGRIVVAEESELAREMEMLQWGTEDRLKENPKHKNHVCDAFIYTRRHLYHRHYKPRLQDAEEYLSEDWWNKKAMQDKANFVEKLARERREADGWMEQMWNPVEIKREDDLI